MSSENNKQTSSAPPPPPVRTSTSSTIASTTFKPIIMNNGGENLPPKPSGNSVQFSLPSPVSAHISLPRQPNNCKVPNCNPPQAQVQTHIPHCGYPPGIMHPMSPISENSSVTNSESTATPGFNASCQQCLAERAAIDKVSVASGANGAHHNLEGVDFPTLPSEETLEVFQNIEETRGRRISDPEPPARTYECEAVCRSTSKLLMGCLGIGFLALGYVAIGGFLFMALESKKTHEILDAPTVMNVTAAVLEFPKEVMYNVDKARSDTVQKLWQVTEQMNILYPENWTRQAAKEIIWFQDQLTKAFAQEFKSLKTQALVQAKSKGHWKADRDVDWTFAKGLLYSVSILTTVGCDYDWATSTLSKILTIVYFLIGIPIMYLYVSNTGYLMARGINLLVTRMTCKSHQIIKTKRHIRANGKIKSPSKGNSQSNNSQLSEKLNLTSLSGGRNRNTWQTKGGAGMVTLVPNGSLNSLTEDSSRRHLKLRPKFYVTLCACALLMLAHILCGTVLVAKSQDWSFSQSFYFCFLSAFTVGYGGLRPHEPHTWACVLYIFFSVAILGTCFYLLIGHWTSHGKRKKYYSSGLKVRSVSTSSALGSTESVSKTR